MGAIGKDRNKTTVTRASDREVMATRSFNAPARIVFQAWSNPELFRRWWVPKSMGMTLVSCEMDVRTGGKYRLEFKHPAHEQTVAFFGSYIEVVPNQLIKWTNEETPDGAVTSVTFQEDGTQTLVELRELYPTKEAFEQSGGSADGLPEQFEQLDEVLPEIVG